MFDLSWAPNFIKIGVNFSVVETQFVRIYNFGSRSSIPSPIFITNMFDLFWVPNFTKIGHIAILWPNLPKFLISSEGMQFQISYIWLTSLTCSEGQISYHWKNISFLGPNFPGMRGFILVLMPNMCYLAVILIFLVVTWWLLLLI